MYQFANDKTPSDAFINGFSLNEKCKNPPDCIILDNWVFENFILADEPFAKILWIFETCGSGSNNLCAKLVSLLEFPVKFNKVTSVPFLLRILTY